jgi:hypothetical protein
MSGYDMTTPQGVSRTWSWQGGSGARIWQLMFLDSGKVLGIKRFPAQKSASLFCLDPETGEALCDNFVLTYGNDQDTPVGEGWMTGLETTHRELLFCHSFQHGSPEHLGLWAVDLPGRIVLWSRPDLVYAANLGDSLLVYRTSVFAGFPERDYWILDSLTGHELEHLGTGHERPNLLRNSAGSEESRQGILLPELFQAGAEPVESIGHGAFRVEGFHCLAVECGLWVSGLRIMMGDCVVYEDTMAAGASMPLFNNFLIRGSTLYYIKGNENLISVVLK